MRSTYGFRKGTLTTFLLWATVAPSAGAEAAKIEALGWLAGSWSGTRDGITSEEHWSSPAGGGLVGMHKDVRNGKMSSFEFFRIIVDDRDQVCYLSSPGGAPPTRFCAVEIGEQRVVFENRLHDFPQRILYWLDAEGKLHARIEGPLDGREASEEWVWSR